MTINHEPSNCTTPAFSPVRLVLRIVEFVRAGIYVAACTVVVAAVMATAYLALRFIWWGMSFLSSCIGG